MIARLRALTTKPLAITETASSSSTTLGTSVAAKSQWITDFYSYVVSHNARMVSWFNSDKETDWAIFGGSTGDSTYAAGSTTYKAYAGYRAAIASTALTPPDTGNPRLLTDTQFAGQ